MADLPLWVWLVGGLLLAAIVALALWLKRDVVLDVTWNRLRLWISGGAESNAPPSVKGSAGNGARLKDVEIREMAGAEVTGEAPREVHGTALNRSSMERAKVDRVTGARVSRE